MHRTFALSAGVFGLSTALILDSVIKGGVLLTLAAIAAWILRRDSAANRYFAWLVAVVATLLIPFLSLLLPEWRVLPNWISLRPAAQHSPASSNTAIANANPSPAESGIPTPVYSEFDTAPQIIGAAEIEPGRELPPEVNQTQLAAPSESSTSTWPKFIPIVWAAGFSLLLTRLWVAHRRLRKMESQSIQVGCTRNPEPSGEDQLLIAMKQAAAQLGIRGPAMARHPVRLLLHPEASMPLVWGVVRPRLLLPAAARQWHHEKLRSVLLHELAHVKRRDPLAQLLIQLACALHWCNPLVWFAAWKLGIEREKACDDLVVENGIRPSAYARHLLDVIAGSAHQKSSPMGGLAMARKSSLERRLLALLSEQSNRRTVSLFMSAVAFVVALGILIPLSMVRGSDDEPPASQPANNSEDDMPPAADIQPAKESTRPKEIAAQNLLSKWKRYARTDGKIPGALVGHLAREVENFVKRYPKDPSAPKLAEILPKVDASHDWEQAELIAILDEITALSTAPVGWTDLPAEFDEMRNLKPGRPLPKELEGAAWGMPAENGLRAAWLFEPTADEYPLGAILPGRVLFHNSGNHAVLFATDTWHQYDRHQMQDADGKPIEIRFTRYTGITPTSRFILAPGEYCEVQGHGIAIGAGEYKEEFKQGRIGAIGVASQGQEVRFSSRIQLSDQGWSRADEPKEPSARWKKWIADRIADEGPTPKSAADREQIIRRAMRDLFGEDPSDEEIGHFVEDDGSNPLESLAARLQEKPALEPFTGDLPTGEVRFKVIAAAPKVDLETSLNWGEAVDGLRAALVVHPAPAPAARNNKPDLSLAIQNVSDAPLRLTDIDVAAETPTRTLFVKRDDVYLAGLGSNDPRIGNVTIAPKEMIFVRVFSEKILENDENSLGQSLIKDLSNDLRQSLIAKFQIESAPQDAWKGTLQTGDFREKNTADVQRPKHQIAQSLYDEFIKSARLNGDIPGGWMELLHTKVSEFIVNNTGDVAGDVYARNMRPLLSRFVPMRDWNPAEISTLLDEINQVTSVPIETTLELLKEQTMVDGTPLPADLESAPWGEPAENGLRLAWMFSPKKQEYRIGTTLNARVLVHNSGQQTVIFHAKTWQQVAHQANNPQGVEFTVHSTDWLTRGLLRSFRLKPGEFIELRAPGIAVGSEKETQAGEVRVGSWILVKPGDEVIVNSSAVGLFDTVLGMQPQDGSNVWLDFIKARLRRELPLPAGGAERKNFVMRASVDLFGAPPSDIDVAHFLADESPEALDALAERLAIRDGFSFFSGMLTSGPTKFKVLAAESNAEK